MYYQGELSEISGYDYILVPGAGVQLTKPGPQLKDRLNTAIALYNQGSAPKIIISGAYNEEQRVHETAVMRVYLTMHDIPADDIICDEMGVNTAETMRRAKAYDGDKKFIVCTQEMYAPRTSFLAKRYKLNVDIADSDIRIYTMGVGKSRLRETFAATKAVFEGIFVRKCTYDLESYPFIMGGTYEE